MQIAPNDPLERQLIRIMGSNREGSFASQRKRSYELYAAARTLKERFGLQKWANLKGKHVRHLVDHSGGYHRSPGVVDDAPALDDT